MSQFGDYGAGAPGWWDSITRGVGSFFGDVVRASGASAGNPRGAIPTGVTVPPAMRGGGGFGARPPQGGMASLIPDRLDRAGRAGGANAGMQGPRQPTAAEIEALRQQYVLDRLALLGGGGGGINLSGFDPMFSDLDARRAGLDTRRGEQEAFLSSLFQAAEGRSMADRGAVASSVQSQLESDSARRAQEIALIRGEEAARRETADLARGALGVEPGEDLSSELAQNLVAGVGSAGSVSDRDARIRQSISEQQFGRELAGLTPMQQMAMMDLNRNYEDRLSGIDSERAALQAQIAQMRAAASGGSRGPSLQEILMLEDRASALYGPGEAPEFSGLLGIEQQFRTRFGSDANEIFGIADRLLSTAMQSGVDAVKPASLNEILQSMRTSDPRLNDFLNKNAGYAAAIINYATSAG
jgi:hypothetical protein